MSWERAKKEANRWLRSIGLEKMIQEQPGKCLDLRPHGATLPFEGEFRDMVLEAARRSLKKRDVDAYLPDE